MTVQATLEDLERERERARSDYLAVSRGAALFASPDEHARAEVRAWERLSEAIAACSAHADATHGTSDTACA